MHLNNKDRWIVTFHNSSNPNSNWWEEEYQKDHDHYLHYGQDTGRLNFNNVDKKRKYLHVSVDYSDLPMNPTDIRGKQLLPKDDTRIFIR